MSTRNWEVSQKKAYYQLETKGVSIPAVRPFEVDQGCASIGYEPNFLANKQTQCLECTWEHQSCV